MNRITLWVANIVVLAALIFLPTYKIGSLDYSTGSVTYSDTPSGDGYHFLGFAFPLSGDFVFLDSNTLVVEAMAIGALLFWVNTFANRTSRKRNRLLLLLPLVSAVLLIVFHPVQRWVPSGDVYGAMLSSGIGVLFFDHGATVIDPRILSLELAALFIGAALFTRRIDRTKREELPASDAVHLDVNAPDDSQASPKQLPFLGLSLP
jgi:hypothetical protein